MGNSQVSVYRTIGPTLVIVCSLFLEVCKAQHFEGIIKLNPELDGVRVSLLL